MNITVFEQRPAPGENKFVPPARWVIVEATSYQWALLALRYVIAPHSHDRFVPWPSVGAWDEVDWDAFRETEDEAAYLSAHRISRYWVHRVSSRGATGDVIADVMHRANVPDPFDGE